MHSNDTRRDLEEAIIDYGFIKYVSGVSMAPNVAEEGDAWDAVLVAIANHEVQCEKEAFDRGFSRAHRRPEGVETAPNSRPFGR